jgi:hypothetical protein
MKTRIYRRVSKAETRRKKNIPGASDRRWEQLYR